VCYIQYNVCRISTAEFQGRIQDLGSGFVGVCGTPVFQWGLGAKPWGGDLRNTVLGIKLVIFLAKYATTTYG